MMTGSRAHVHAEGTAAGPAAAHATGATGAGSVVLELGGDTGVLVLHVPARLHGTEIEIGPEGAICPEGDGSCGQRTHSLVRERVTAAGASYAAVYPGVPAGRYTIWGDDDVPVGMVVIVGGQVTSFRWPVPRLTGHADSR
jgi:hypothetical protein